MDCGPASLKCLLEGFGTPVAYGRLREACQAGIDGTSIDTMEAVANQLGLEAEQIMLPMDHLLLDDAKTLPAIVVVKLPNGLTHFVVVWRRHRNTVQLMDPAVGRRWTRVADFTNEVYQHTMRVGAAEWREFAASEDFQGALRMRLARLGLAMGRAEPLIARALADESWRALAALDASVRLTASLVRTGALGSRRDALDLVEQLCTKPELVPVRYWSVRAARENEDDQEQVLMRGAVLVRVRAKRSMPAAEPMNPELQAAIEERPISPGRELLRILRDTGPAVPGILILALGVAAGAVVIEALLFRGVFAVSSELGWARQRLGAMAAILLFSFALLLLELPIFYGAARLGRQLENRLRIAFLTKIPRLSDRYFQSRLTSDMAERSHATHRLRHLPDLGRQMLRNIFELCATAVGIICLDPTAAPFVLVTLAAALVPVFTTQSVLAERDLRVRSHAAGLTRFYLDAMLGLVCIRAHSAEQSVRREHGKLLREWANAALRLQKTVAVVEAVQMTAMFALVAALLLLHPLEGANLGRLLLVVYWALNLPVLGQEIAALSRQYPYYRNLNLRLLEPLGAPEEQSSRQDAEAVTPVRTAPCLEFRNVAVEASGHKILEGIDVRIEAGSQVAIVGPSGSGKSSLVGILLGWLKPSKGEVLVNGQPLDCDALRLSTAWVDPAVQLWNRSLLSNLCYASEPEASAIRTTIDAALLRPVLESLPQGFETKLGEGGGLVSGGEGQRVRLGRAMLRKHARLVILDEAFRGLDREKRRELLARAREYWRGATMLCITHDLSETQGFDRVLVIEQGRIAEDGTPEELRVSPESRYRQLLDAEEQTRSGLWRASIWRRIRIISGRIVEEHKTGEQKTRESEVA